ncbi:MAG: hypothetical protein WC197_08045 [Candidatus Gastranaerophilaceae bacterium]|jgi:hypothetical protein
MIIKAFSEELHKLKTNTSSVVILVQWIKKILYKKPVNNVERIINTEIGIEQDKTGSICFVGKSKSGTILINSLYNFALSFDHHKFVKWLHERKASDFNNKRYFL